MPDEYHLEVASERSGFSPLRVLLLILVVGGAIWLYCQYGTQKASTDRAADEKKQQQLMQQHELERCGPGGVACR